MPLHISHSWQCDWRGEKLASQPSYFPLAAEGKETDARLLLSSAGLWGKILRSAPGSVCCDGVGCSLYTDGLTNESTLQNRVLNQGY